MKVLFHTNDLGLRGTAQAVYDYAHFAETILGWTSAVVYPSNAASNDPGIVAKFSSRFQITGYDRLEEISGSGADLTYFIKSGKRDGLLSPDTASAIHAVFQEFDPHGESYAYVSDWLAQHCTGGRYPYVPHIVDLPSGQSRRSVWGVPEDAFVFGRYGGYDTFDIDFVKRAVPKLLEDKRIWFVFVNTERFIDHPRVLFRDAISRPTDKSDFILSCDAMLHGRERGESFGLAICEFLFHGKPVLAWAGGKDGNHRRILGSQPGALYKDQDDLVRKALALVEGTDQDWKALVAPFSPEAVMPRFAQVFTESAAPSRGIRVVSKARFMMRKVVSS